MDREWPLIFPHTFYRPEKDRQSFDAVDGLAILGSFFSVQQFGLFAEKVEMRFGEQDERHFDEQVEKRRRSVGYRRDWSIAL